MGGQGRVGGRAHGGYGSFGRGAAGGCRPIAGRHLEMDASFWLAAGASTPGAPCNSSGHPPVPRSGNEELVVAGALPAANAPSARALRPDDGLPAVVGQRWSACGGSHAARSACWSHAHTLLVCAGVRGLRRRRGRFALRGRGRARAHADDRPLHRDFEQVRRNKWRTSPSRGGSPCCRDGRQPVRCSVLRAGKAKRPAVPSTHSQVDPCFADSGPFRTNSALDPPRVCQEIGRLRPTFPRIDQIARDRPMCCPEIGQSRLGPDSTGIGSNSVTVGQSRHHVRPESAKFGYSRSGDRQSWPDSGHIWPDFG